MAKPKNAGENMPAVEEQAPKVEAPVEEKASKLDRGPKRGPAGEYLPARYPTQRGKIRTDR